MTIHLSEKLHRMIESRIIGGQYASAEDVVFAALNALGQDEHRPQFEENEWNTLLAEGELGGPSLSADSVFDELRSLSKSGKAD